LNFSLNKEGLECRQMKGYYLADDQLIPSLGDLSHYLVLEKGEKKIVLFPNVELKKVTSGSLITDTYPDRIEGLTLMEYFVYDVENEGIIPKTDEGRLYLATMHLWKQEYTQALKELQGKGAQIRTYTAREIKLLEGIVDLKSRNFDNDPKALAIAQYAAMLLLKNQIDFGGSLPDSNDISKPSAEGLKKGKEGSLFIKKIASICTELEQKREQIPQLFLLGLEDEKLLLQAIKSYGLLNEQLEYRLAKLEGEIEASADLLVKMQTFKTSKIPASEIAVKLLTTLQKRWRLAEKPDSTS
jgi:hypothetical protein